MDTIVNLIIFFILGSIFGSFINVLILRYKTGRSFVTGRSQCFSCSKKLEWYELVPIFSYIFLRGKCLGCRSRISVQYPIIELLTAVIFSAIFWKVGLSMLLPLYLFSASLLVAIFIYDLKHKIIPNEMVFSFNFLALLILISNNFSMSAYDTTLNFLAGPILFTFFWFFWFISNGKWMGFGDAKLALGVGWLLGLYGGIFAIMSAFWIGALISIIILSIQAFNIKKYGISMKSEIPFAPFIIFGLFLQFFTGWSLMTLLHL